MPPAERRRPRAAAARVLRGGGALLVVGGLVLAYANRVVFDSQAFARRSAEALADPRVSGYVAERVADQVVARDRDLLAFRPLIVGAARLIVASEPFRAVFRRAAASAHEVALSRGAREVYFSLPDLALLLETALSRAQPELAAKLPRGLQAQLGEDVQMALGPGALRLLRAASRLGRYALLCLVLGSAGLVGSVALCRDRRRALLATGFVLAAAALLLFLLPPVLGLLLSARIADSGLRLAARGVFDAFAGPLRSWGLVLAGMGLVLSAAASSFAGRVEVEHALAAGWRWLRLRSSRPGAELRRALALTALGLLAVLEPWALVRFLTVVIGAALAFEGLRGLFGLLAPRIDAAGGTAPGGTVAAARPGPGLHVVRYTLLALIAGGLVAAGAAWLRSPAALPTVTFTGRCNGSTALCDRTLDQVVFAGAHNAMAAGDIPGWMFPNQEQGMAAQLRHGIRALLFDVHNGVPVAGRVKTVLEHEPGSRAKFEQALGRQGVAAAMRVRDRLVGPPEGAEGPYLCHGFCELGAQPLAPALREIRDFLVQNPGEVLLIVIEDYVRPAEIAKAFEESGLLAHVYRGRPGPPWPTLRQMIDSDQRVVVAAENDNGGGSVPWYAKAYDFMQETPYHFEAIDQLSCRANRGGDGKSLFLMNHWIDTTPAPRPSNAAVINQKDYLVARARQCEQQRGRMVNVLAVDFALTGDVVGAAAELNARAE